MPSGRVPSQACSILLQAASNSGVSRSVTTCPGTTQDKKFFSYSLRGGEEARFLADFLDGLRVLEGSRVAEIKGSVLLLVVEDEVVRGRKKEEHSSHGQVMFKEEGVADVEEMEEEVVLDVVDE